MPSCDFNAIATCTCAECNAYYRRNDEVVETKENQNYKYDLLSTTQLPEQRVVSCPIMKTCLGCSIAFEREAHFFRAGATWQSRCKRCHVIRDENTKTTVCMSKRVGAGHITVMRKRLISDKCLLTRSSHR